METQKMSDPIEHLNSLHNNPFIFAPALAAFFDSIGDKENGFLLAYLLLPITLHLPARNFLQKARPNSNLRTMLKDHTYIHGLSDRVIQYKDLTNITINYLLDLRKVVVQDQLKISVNGDIKFAAIAPPGLTDASVILGNFFRPYEVQMIFRMLGVMSL